MRRSVALFLPFAWAVGCSSAAGDPPDSGVKSCPPVVGSCSKDVASDPSYADEVEPILKNNCAVCHSPEGGIGYDLVTYAEVHGQAEQGDLISWISECSMPPSSYPPLTTAQRQTLLDWLACGAPDN
jgi:hypothetical protein